MGVVSETTHKMLLIKSIAPDASLKLSEWTMGWYVDARLDIGDGCVLTGVTEHRDSPAGAVDAFLDRITSIPNDHYLATAYAGERREWRWNGAAFVQATRGEVLATPGRPIPKEGD